VERAEHRAWIEFGATILSDIYAIETTPDAGLFEAKRQALVRKFARLEGVLDAGPYFSGEHFSLVDAAFGPVFRYFEVFDTIADLGIMSAQPKVAAWRGTLAARASVRAAVGTDYPDCLWRFLDQQDSHLRTMMHSASKPHGGPPQRRATP